MEKQKRNYVEELENLKTAFLGYDKEAVLDYIQILLDALEEEQQQAVREISKQNLALTAENAALLRLPFEIVPPLTLPLMFTAPDSLIVQLYRLTPPPFLSAPQVLLVMVMPDNSAT